MKITKFDKANLAQLRREIDAALKVVAERNGIDLSIGSISFSGAEFSTKLKAAVKDTAAKDRAHALGLKMVGLPADAFSRIFKDAKGRVYQLTEINARGKFDVRAVEVATGAHYKMTSDYVKKCMGV